MQIALYYIIYNMLIVYMLLCYIIKYNSDNTKSKIEMLDVLKTSLKCLVNAISRKYVFKASFRHL